MRFTSCFFIFILPYLLLSALPCRASDKGSKETASPESIMFDAQAIESNGVTITLLKRKPYSPLVSSDPFVIKVTRNDSFHTIYPKDISNILYKPHQDILEVGERIYDESNSNTTFFVQKVRTLVIAASKHILETLWMIVKVDVESITATAYGLKDVKGFAVNNNTIRIGTDNSGTIKKFIWNQHDKMWHEEILHTHENHDTHKNHGLSDEQLRYIRAHIEAKKINIFSFFPFLQESS